MINKQNSSKTILQPRLHDEMNDFPTENKDSSPLTPNYSGSLDLSNKMIVELLPHITDKFPKNLYDLNLRQNRLLKFPPILFNYPTLQILDMNGNKITQLPQEFIQLSQLVELYLNNNILTQLPIKMNNLKGLRILHLSSNWLSYIPPDLPWIQLVSLWIDKNQFVQLPIQFKGLENCVNLHLDWFRYAQPELQKNYNMKQNKTAFRKFKSRINELEEEGKKFIQFQDFIQVFSRVDPDYSVVDAFNRNLLHLAAQDENLGVITVLCDSHPNLMKDQDKDWHTPLSLALMESRFRSAIVLLECGVDPNQKNTPFGTCLHLAVFKRQTDMVAKLISMGADPDQKDVDGNIPLHLIFKSWQKNEKGISKLIANILLKAGSSPNIKNNENWTPLHEAIRKFQVGSIKFAIKYNLSRAKHNGLQMKPTNYLELFSFTKIGGPKDITFTQLAASTGVVNVINIIFELHKNPKSSPNYIDILQESKKGFTLNQICYPALVLKQWSRKIYKDRLIKQILVQKIEVTSNLIPNQLSPTKYNKYNNITIPGDEILDDSLMVPNTSDNDTQFIPQTDEIIGIQVIQTDFPTNFQKKQTRKRNNLEIELANFNIKTQFEKIQDQIVSDTSPLTFKLHLITVIAFIQEKIINPYLQLTSLDLPKQIKLFNSYINSIEQFKSNHHSNNNQRCKNINHLIDQIITDYSKEVSQDMIKFQMYIHPQIDLQDIKVNEKRAIKILKNFVNDGFKQVKHYYDQIPYEKFMSLMQALSIKKSQSNLQQEQKTMIQKMISHNSRLTIFQYEMVQENGQVDLNTKDNNLIKSVTYQSFPKSFNLSAQQSFTTQINVKLIKDDNIEEEQKINFSNRTLIANSPFKRKGR